MLNYDAARMILACEIHNNILYRPENPFRLKSGKRTPVKFDIGLLAANPAIGEACAVVLSELFDFTPETVFVGVPSGGNYLAAALAYYHYNASKPHLDSAHDNPWFVEMAKPKRAGHKHGLFSPEAAALIEGRDVVVVEDVLTTGASTLFTSQKVAAAGGKVKAVCALVNRGGNAPYTLIRQATKDKSMFPHEVSLGCVFDALDAEILENVNDNERARRIREALEAEAA